MIFIYNNYYKWITMNKLNELFVSPLFVLSCSYMILFITIVSLYFMDLMIDGSFFSWGPPINMFGVTIDSNLKFYGLMLIYFVHQLANNWSTNVVYPYIINNIQDSKSNDYIYNKYIAITITVGFTIYSLLDIVFVINGSLTQVSFLIVIVIAEVIPSFCLNIKYINRIDVYNKNVPFVIEAFNTL